MTGRFNEPRLMGNCENCYYFVPRAYENSKEGICHRYPEPISTPASHYCGEFAWATDAATVGGACK